MHRFRRPFPVTRRDTDDVQLNTLNGSEKAEKLGGKDGDVEVAIESQDVENGHMQEIEVDMDKVLGDVSVEDIEADTSPYPEGESRGSYQQRSAG